MNAQPFILFVTHNSERWIDSMFDSIDAEHAVIFDNASTDDTLNICRTKYPLAKLICNKSNIGYGRAANILLAATDAKYALLLNPDVNIGAEQVGELLDLAKNMDEDWFYIAPNTGHTVTSLGKESASGLLPITHATGCALLFNLKNFRYLGGFDENIFLYYEEMDLSVRAHNRGLKMYYAENIRCPHNSKQSVAETDSLNKIRNWHFQWSSLYYKKKHHLWGPLIESILANLVASPIKQLVSNGEKAEKYRLKRRATLDFLLGKKAFLENGEPYIPD